MSTQPPLDEAAAKQRLCSYVFYERHGTEILFVPHRIPLEVGRKFILGDVKGEVKVEPLANACNVVRFYLLRDCLDHLSGLAPQRPHDLPDMIKGLQAANLLGNLGDPRRQKAAEEKFDQTLRYANVEEVGEPLVWSFFHLGPDASPNGLTERLKKAHQERLKKLPDPDQPDTPTNLLFALAHQKLPQVLAAKAAKEAMLKLPQPESRAYRIGAVYLGLTEHSVYAQEWAGYALLDQADRGGPKPVVAGLHSALAELQRVKFDEGDEEFVTRYLRDAKGRAHDAIRYFGGEPTDEEKKFLGSAKNWPQNLFSETQREGVA